MSLNTTRCPSFRYPPNLFICTSSTHPYNIRRSTLSFRIETHSLVFLLVVLCWDLPINILLPAATIWQLLGRYFPRASRESTNTFSLDYSEPVTAREGTRKNIPIHSLVVMFLYSYFTVLPPLATINKEQHCDSIKIPIAGHKEPRAGKGSSVIICKLRWHMSEMVMI